MAVITVLLADDSEIVRTAIARLLKDDPEIQLVAEAVNFPQTIRLISTVKPQLVVMDLHMDGERGLTDVKSHLNGSGLLAISLWNDIETRDLAESYGAAALIDKANLARELIPAIKQFANKQK